MEGNFDIKKHLNLIQVTDKFNRNKKESSIWLNEKQKEAVIIYQDTLNSICMWFFDEVLHKYYNKIKGNEKISLSLPLHN